MKKLLAIVVTFVLGYTAPTEALAQVANFNSLSLHFSNTILTTVKNKQALTIERAGENDDEEKNKPGTKQHLAALPATGLEYGDNAAQEQADILAQPALDAEPMAAALSQWVSSETALQQPKRRLKR